MDTGRRLGFTIFNASRFRVVAAKAKLRKYAS